MEMNLLRFCKDSSISSHIMCGIWNFVMSKNMKLINFKQSAANLCHLVSCIFLSRETRLEKLSALNFRLLSPETWKSWHWVSGNQELPPDFHLQSWQKFQIGRKDKTKNFHLQYWKIWSFAECQFKSCSTTCKRFPFVVILYLCLHGWTMDLIRVQGNISLEADNRPCC